MNPQSYHVVPNRDDAGRRLEKTHASSRRPHIHICGDWDDGAGRRVGRPLSGEPFLAACGSKDRAMKMLRSSAPMWTDGANIATTRIN